MHAPIRQGDYTRLVPGDIVGGSAGMYRILKQLGEQGAMSTVYMVQNLQDQQTQTLKAVLDIKNMPDPSQGPDIIARFADEVKILSRINNEHVVRLIDRDPDPQPQFYVMEYAFGGSLKSFLDNVKVQRRDQQISPASKAKVVAQILDGLNAFAIAAQRIAPAGTVSRFAHRDIKPDNIFIQLVNNVPASVKIADFGIVKLPDSDKTKTGIIMGTPSYMSPEAFMGAKDVDQRSDIWAMGAIFYWLMTGVEPFEYLEDRSNWPDFVARPGDHVKALMQRLDPNVPLPLWKIISTALAPKPEGRYQTYRDFHLALINFVNSQ